LVLRSDVTEGSDSAEKAFSHTLVDDVRKEWRLLWRERIDDRVRAEGIANRDYSLLFVEGGTVIVATRDFKPLDLREILCMHEVQDVERVVSPHPSVGGWGKFMRTVLKGQKRTRRRPERPAPPRKRKKNQQLKKGGRGWLHYSMKW